MVSNGFELIGEHYHPIYGLGEFRHVVARFFKLLIRARLKHDQKFISDELLSRWGLGEHANDHRTSDQLLRDASGTYDLISRYYLPRSGSGGLGFVDNLKPEGRVIETVVGFFDAFDGGGIGKGTLLSIADEVKSNPDFDWSFKKYWDIEDWEKLLSKLRDDLDLLPAISAEVNPSSHTHSQTGLRNRFVYEDGQWNIEYNGVVKNFRQSVGLFYIHLLIDNMGKLMTARDIRKNYMNWDNLAIKRRDFHIEQSGYEGNDIGINLVDYDRPLTRTGSIYEFRSQHKKDQDQVRNNINNALARLKVIMPVLYSHLHRNLKIGHPFSYNPETPVTWELSK